MGQPTVSVIIPTVDRHEQLTRAVASAVDQTYDPIEIVIVEEGVSEPQVPALIESMHTGGRDVVHIFNETLGGPGTARNQAVSRSSGAYVAFLDDDDEWAETKIEKQLSRMRETGREVCYTGAERIGPDGKLRATTVPEVEGDARSRTLRGNIIGPSVLTVSRKAFSSIDGFDDAIPFWEDWDFTYRLSRQYQFTGVSEALVKIHTDADHRRSDTPKKAEAGARYLVEKHTPMDHAKQRFATRRFESRLWNGAGRSALMNGQFGDARRHFARAARRWPFDRSLLLYGGLSLGGSPLLSTAQTVNRRLRRLGSSHSS